MKLKHFPFSVIFGTILVNFVLKGALLITRYALSGRAVACEHRLGGGDKGSGGDNGSSAAGESDSVSHEFILTTAVYGVLSVLRFLEYLVLAVQFYRFLFIQNIVNPSDFWKKHSKRYHYLLLFSVILLPYFLLGFVIPSLGIYQELDHSTRIEECYNHYPQVYITYCVINFIRYMSAYAVRIVFIFTTLAISKFWFPEHEGVPAHISSGHIQLDKWARREVTENHLENVAEIIENHSAEEAESIPGPQDDNKPEDFECHSHETSVRVNKEKKALHDWKLVTEDFQNRSTAYYNIGEQVKLIQDLFQTWFIIPWIFYLVTSSLKTYNILRPWNLDGDGNSPPSDIPQIYYLLYNVNQFITLLIPFVCAKKINTYHQKYYKMMRESQLKEFWDDPSQLSLARQLIVEKNESFDFVPRIWGTQISINVSSPLYIILLLVGLFLSVTKSLLNN